MRRIILLFSIFIPILVFTQTSLTNGEVFDYNVGDIIQSRSQPIGIFGPIGPPTYHTTTVLGKLVSINNDTIFYTFKRDNYTPPSCQTCNPSYSSDTVVSVITNLTLPVLHNNQTTCYPTRDTIYLAFCNRLVWERLPNIDTTLCFEPTSHSTQFVKGVGGPFFDLFEPMGPQGYENVLVYYQKSGDVCGSIVTSIQTQSYPPLKMDIYPNPSSEVIYLRSEIEFIYFDIMDLRGKVHISKKLTNNSIDISNIRKGSYIINFYDKDYRVATRKIEKL